MTSASAATVSVSGTVTRAGTSEPLAGISVTAVSNLGTMTSATTDAQGHYAMQATGTTSRFMFSSPRTITEWYGGGEDMVTAATVPLTGSVEISADLKDAGRITGTYDGATKAYFTSRRVDGEAASVSGDISDGTFEGWVTTEKPLHLGLHLNPDGNSFVVWNGNKFGRQHSEPVQVDSGSTVSGLHFAYPETATLTGRTTNSSGLPVRLSYFADVLEDGDWVQVRNGTSGRWDGAFSVVVPASLPVTVSARSPFNTDGFVETWLGGSQDVAQAETLAAEPGTTTAVGDIVVAGGETLEGAVQDSGGKPVAGITVNAFRERTDELIGSTTTDELGHYAIPGLGVSATGQVTVAFSGDRIASSWGRNQSSQIEASLIGLASWNAGTQTVTHLPEYQVQTASPTLTGSGLVGTTVTATPGTATPTPTDTEFWWYCGSTPLGVQGAQYLVTAADTGCALNARQLSVLDGHGTGVATSSPVTVKRFEVLDLPFVYGARVVGTRLRITNLQWSAAPDTITYQWLRSGKPISGATAATYVPTLVDIGDVVSVRITGHRSAEGISTTRLVEGSPIVRARTALRVVSIVPRRGRTDIALRFTSPGVTRPGGYVQVWRHESGGGMSSVTRLPLAGSPQTLRFTYRSYYRSNRLIFQYNGSKYAAPAQISAAVYVR